MLVVLLAALSLVAAGCEAGSPTASTSAEPGSIPSTSSSSPGPEQATVGPSAQEVQIRGLDAVPAGYALMVEGESMREFTIARKVTALILPERGYFEMLMSGGPDVGPAEMTITVRTPEKQLGYRSQVVFEGTPREMQMAYLFSPLTYPSGWRVLKMSQKGTHISATLGRGIDPAVEEMTVEAEVDPQTGVLTREEQKNQHGTATITRRLVPIEDVGVSGLEAVLAAARADWADAFARAESLGYPVFGIDLPALQTHFLFLGDEYVWLNYSTRAKPGHLAVEMWQVTRAEAERLSGRFPTSWTSRVAENGDPGHMRTYMREDRGVQILVHDWVTKQGIATLKEIEAALVPLAETLHVKVPEPAVIVFDGPMPLPSGADFGGLIAR